MLSVIPAHLLSGFELSRLGHNLVAAVRHDRDACRPKSSERCVGACASGAPVPPRNDGDENDGDDPHEDDGKCVCNHCDMDPQIEAATRSEHVAW